VPGKIQSSLRPVPVPDDLTRPYWDGAKERRLVIQRCQECKTYWHPPLHQCMRCESRNLTFEQVSGQGRIYSCIRVHDSQIKAFVDALPYFVVHVELDEQPWLLVTCNMAEADPSEIEIGATVEVTFEEISEGHFLPDFKPAAHRG